MILSIVSIYVLILILKFRTKFRRAGEWIFNFCIAIFLLSFISFHSSTKCFWFNLKPHPHFTPFHFFESSVPILKFMMSDASISSSLFVLFTLCESFMISSCIGIPNISNNVVLFGLPLILNILFAVW